MYSPLKQPTKFWIAFGFIAGVSTLISNTINAQDLTLVTRQQKAIDATSKSFEAVEARASWAPNETAIILCDFWDYHHCLNAVRRMNEFGPRLNMVLKQARARGVTIIHSPSDCMDAYKNHAARQRVLSITSKSSKVPKDIENWCSKIPSEEVASFPIDQSDGGEDDDPEEHEIWAQKLAALGRNPKMPWKKQNVMIDIDSEKDFISDRGDEVWNVLTNRKIKNVILAGVHTNMCVLGRPFGLRQMKRTGFNTVLMRDMTDTMYNPNSWPYVSHYAGTDLVIEHIERNVCPTITSDQIIGGEPFSFKNDKRPHLAIVIGEKEYKTNESLPQFAGNHLRDFRVTFFHASPSDRNDFPGISSIADADILLVSVRRRVLKPDQMKVFKDFEASGKPIIGIRTASHAFSLRDKKPPKWFDDWPEFDAKVFGGNYSNHFGNKLSSKVMFSDDAIDHPITKSFCIDKSSALSGDEVKTKIFGQGGSLYKTSPLRENTTVLLSGTVLGHPPEPVAWTFKRANGGQSFYTSLGHVDDFKNSIFRTLLINAIRCLAKIEPVDQPKSKPKTSSNLGWMKIDSISFPQSLREKLTYKLSDKNELDKLSAFVAFRSVVRIPQGWSQSLSVSVAYPNAKCWVNGSQLIGATVDGTTSFKLPATNFDVDQANWLMIGLELDPKNRITKPIACRFTTGDRSIEIKSKWQWAASDRSFKNATKIHLPAKFGGSPDVFTLIR